MHKTRNIVLTGLMIGIGLILPFIVSFIPNGTVLFSPLHIPALLAGLVLGPWEGLITGLVLPLLRSVLFGIPPLPTALSMTAECAMYGFISGLCMQKFSLKGMKKIYISLLLAMLAGRIAGGLVHALILNVGSYTPAIWFSSYFISTVPAIITQLILLPIIVRALQKAGFVRS